MKIKSLDIKGFGRFKQVKINPEAGFNMIYADNESGKSTLQAFIRAMFYGQRGGRRSKEGTLPPLKQYKPWNSDQYAGVMEYVLENGDLYRVGRNFDKGTTNIYDKVSNNATMQFAQDRDIGPKFAEEHLGIDEATFERSAFIRQLQCAIDDDGRKNLVEKLSNLSATGSEDISLTQAVHALETTLLERVGTGRSAARPLDRLNTRLSDLEQRKQKLLTRQEQYLDTAMSLHEKKHLLNDLIKDLEQKKKKKEALKAKNLKTLNQELGDLSREKALVQEELTQCGMVIRDLKRFESITEDSLSKAVMLLHDQKREKELIESEAERLQDLQNKGADLKEALDPDEIFQRRMKTVKEALENYTLLKEKKDKTARNFEKRKAPVKPSWSTGIMFLIGCMALLLMGQYIKNPSPVVLGIGLLIIAVLGVLLSYFNIRKTHIKLHEQTNADILNGVLAEVGFGSMSEYIQYRESQLKIRGSLENINKEIFESKRRLNLCEEKSSNYEMGLDRILLHHMNSDKQTDRASVAESLKLGVESLAKAKQKERILISRKSAIEDKFRIILREAGTMAGQSFLTVDDFINFLAHLSQINEPVAAGDILEPQLAKELEMTIEGIEQVKLEVAALNTRLELAPSEGELTDVIEEIALLTGKKEKLEMMGSSLTLAKEILNETALKLQRDYVPALNDSASNMMSMLTSGRYKILRTNDKLQVNLEVPETDELIPANRLSGGTIDQVYFCMRLGAVLLIEKGRELLPLFLDEPFSQYDETRVLKAFELLKEISGERQVFFFTCREREFELAQSVFGAEMAMIHL